VTSWLIKAQFTGAGEADTTEPLPASRASLLSATVCGTLNCTVTGHVEADTEEEALAATLPLLRHQATRFGFHELTGQSADVFDRPATPATAGI
jgi:hypothetical protein